MKRIFLTATLALGLAIGSTASLAEMVNVSMKTSLGEITLEREIGTDHPLPVGHAERPRLWTVAQRMHVLGTRLGAVIGAGQRRR